MASTALRRLMKGYGLSATLPIGYRIYQFLLYSNDECAEFMYDLNLSRR